MKPHLSPRTSHSLHIRKRPRLLLHALASSLALALCACGGGGDGDTTPPLADGTYVYHVTGQKANGPYTVSGAFTVAGGVIAGGEQDYTDVTAGYVNGIVAATSSLGMAGGNVQVVLDTGNTAVGVNGIETLRAAKVSSSRLLVSGFDPKAVGTGSIDLQTSRAAPSAGYAFAVSGSNVAGNLVAIGGVMNIVGTAVSPTGSVFDISTANPATKVSSMLQEQAFQSGSVTAPDAYGRVVFTLTPSTVSGVPPLALAGYIVSPDRIQLVESAQSGDLLNANTGGVALGQGANTGTFSAASASIAGQSYAHGSMGLDLIGGVALSGAFALNTNGTLGGVLALNDLTYVGAWDVAGLYSVDPTGRVTVFVNSLTSQTAMAPTSSMSFQMYLDGKGNAMMLGGDAFEATQGIAYTQASTTLNGHYALAGLSAIPTPSGNAAWSAAGLAAVSNTNFGGSVDFNSGNDRPRGNVALGGFQDAAHGLLHLVGLSPYDAAASSGFGYYPVSGNRMWALEVDRNSASLLLLEGVTP